LDNSARKELEQRKDAFIGMASHELKSPLTALKLHTSLLHRQLAKQGIAAAPALSSMETQINKVTRLVEELLDISKIQVGRLEYIWEMVDLDALLQEITETVQSRVHPLKSLGGQIPFRKIALQSFYTNRGFVYITSDNTNILPNGAKLGNDGSANRACGTGNEIRHIFLLCFHISTLFVRLLDKQSIPLKED
jgi:signal transduction histidine kinase